MDKNTDTGSTRGNWEGVELSQSRASKGQVSSMQESQLYIFKVSGDINLIGKLGDVHFKPILNRA